MQWKPCRIDGKKWAVPGTDLCTLHGGRLPQIKKQAEEAVENARRRLEEQPNGPLHVNSPT